MAKVGYVYILTNKYNRVLYTGVTSKLEQRIYQHKHKTIAGFSSRYNCQKLVWFERCAEISIAIEKEKKIKAGSRAKKISLIESMNPYWHD